MPPGASVLFVKRFSGNPARNLGVLILALSYLIWVLLSDWLALLLPGLSEQSLAQKFKSSGVFNGIRTQLLAFAWTMFAENPVLGTGLGTLDQWVFWRPLPAGSEPLILSNTEHAHNTIAQLGAESGIFAILPLLLIGKVFFSQQPDNAAGAWVGGVSGSLLMVFSLIEYPFWYLHFLGLFVLLMVSFTHAEKWTIKASITQRASVCTAIGVMLIAAILVVKDYQRLETLPEKRTPPGQIFSEFNAISRNPLIGQHARSFLAANLSPSPNRLPEKLALCRRAVADFADIAVICACLPTYAMGATPEEANQLRERFKRSVAQSAEQLTR